MILELISLKKALASLEEIIKVISDPNYSQLRLEYKNAIRAGVVQNFEFTYELCWKFMKRYLENQLGASMVDGISRNELFRLSAEFHLIDDFDLWKKYHTYRNLTSHTYDEDVAEELVQIARDFVIHANKFLLALEARND